jgi:hypothetical protein
LPAIAAFLGGFAPLRVHPIDLALVHGPEGESDYFAIPNAELAARSAFGSFHYFGTEHVASAVVEILDQSDAIAIHLVNSSPAFRLGSLDNLWRQNPLPSPALPMRSRNPADSGGEWRRDY